MLLAPRPDFGGGPPLPPGFPGDPPGLIALEVGWFASSPLIGGEEILDDDGCVVEKLRADDFSQPLFAGTLDAAVLYDGVGWLPLNVCDVNGAGGVGCVGVDAGDWMLGAAMLLMVGRVAEMLDEILGAPRLSDRLFAGAVEVRDRSDGVDGLLEADVETD